MVNKKGFYSRLVLTNFMVKSLKYSKSYTSEGMEIYAYIQTYIHWYPGKNIEMVIKIISQLVKFC